MLEVAPHFRIVAWPEARDAPPSATKITITLAPGKAFGDGRHETTQLCLQAIGALAPRGSSEWRLLDFGSGTGILAIAAAKLGATAHGVEIDPDAIGVAEQNAMRSGVEERVTFGGALPAPSEAFDFIVANILRDVLLESAPDLAARLSAGGLLVLSGLVSTDVPAVSARYARELGGRRPEIYERGDWRALVWR